MIGSPSSSRRACVMITPDGLPCLSPPMKTSDWCFTHDPSPKGVEARTKARVRGGHARSRKPIANPALQALIDVSSADAILQSLQRVAVALASGDISPNVASKLISVCREAAAVHGVRETEALRQAVAEASGEDD